MISAIFAVFFEWKITNTIAFPGYVIHFLDRSFWLATFLLLGYHGKGNLATGLLATSVLNLTIYFMEGFLSSQDVFIFQSRNNEKMEKVWLYITMVYVIISTILGAGLIVAFEFYLYGFLTMKTNVTFKTTVYLWFLLPALFFHGLQRSLQQYFTIKSIYSPVVVSLLLGLICNSIGSSFMFYVEIGPLGCAISIAIAKMITAISLAYFANKHFNDSDFLLDMWLILKLFYKKVKSLFLALIKMRLPRNVVRSTSKSSSSKKKPGRNNSSSRILPQEDILNDHSAHSIQQNAKRKPRKALNANDERKENEVEDGLELTQLREENTSIREYKDDEEDDDEVLLHRREDAEPLLDDKNSNSSQMTRLKFSSVDTMANFVRYGIVGVPGGILMAIDFWPYELTCLFIAHLGTVALDTHQMLLIFAQYAAIVLVLPLSTASTVRIQTLLKAKDYKLACTTAWVAIIQGLMVSCVVALIIFLLQFNIGYMFSNNMDVVHRTEKMVFFSSFFSIPYGLQMTLKGVIRAANFQVDMIGVEIVAIWVIGIPLGLYLAYYARPTFGLEGMWIGLLVGSGLLSAALLLQVILLDWKKEGKKFTFRLKQYANNLTGTSATGIYLNEIALPNVASLAIGGFQLRAKSIQEEIEEIEVTEFSDVENLNSSVDNEDVGLELTEREKDNESALLV